MAPITVPAGYEIEYTDSPRQYKIDGKPVPSVTEVLGILDKHLGWWGMKIGAEGVASLLQGRDALGVENLCADPVGELTRAKLTVNHQRDSAAKRGSIVHDALEALVGEGIQPDDSSLPEDQRGYFAALRAWYEDARPEVQDAEVIVGSKEHGFAGRYDLRAILGGEKDLVVRAETGQREPFDGSYRLDLKTSKGIYPTHLLQLDAYELAAEECGYPFTDEQAVLRLAQDGTYEMVRNTCPEEAFLDVLGAFHAVKQAKPQYPRKIRQKALQA